MLVICSLKPSTHLKMLMARSLLQPMMGVSIETSWAINRASKALCFFWQKPMHKWGTDTQCCVQKWGKVWTGRL